MDPTHQPSVTFVDDWLVAMQHQLSHIPILRNDHLPNHHIYLNQTIQPTTTRVPTHNPTRQPPQTLQRAINKPPHHKTSTNQIGKTQCKKCPELFETRVNARRHLRACHPKNKKEHQCHHCTASYHAQAPKTLHMTKAHPEFMPPIPNLTPISKRVNGQLRYFCCVPGCMKSYNMRNNVKRHYQMHHLKIRFPCVCGHKATTKSNLGAHQTTCRIHRAKFD